MSDLQHPPPPTEQPPEPSAFIGDVLALSWSPFLLVSTVTVLIFLLLASVTFAMMKYVDLTTGAGLLPPPLSSSGGPACNGPPSSSTYAPSSNSSSSAASQRSEPRAESELAADAASEAPEGLPGGRRARVVAVGAKRPLSSRLSAGRELELNGAAVGQSSAALLNNWRLKLQQFAGPQTEPWPEVAGSQQQQVGKLKQSSSDNFLNQAAGEPQPALAANWTHSRAPHYQAAYCSGTLPRHCPGPEASNLARPIRQAGPDHFQAAYNYLRSGQASLSMLAAPVSAGTGAIGPAHQLATSGSDGPIERMVISGKQYIHQARPEQHLQMTSGFNSLQRAPSMGPHQASHLYGARAAQKALVCMGQLEPTSGHCHLPAGQSGESRALLKTAAELSWAELEQLCLLCGQQQHGNKLTH